MTLDEAVETLRVLSTRHADGTSWSEGDEYLTADFHAPTEADYDAVSRALLEVDEAASIVLAVLDDRSRQQTWWPMAWTGHTGGWQA